MCFNLSPTNKPATMMQMRVQSASHSSMLCVVSTVQHDLSCVVTCASGV